MIYQPEPAPYTELLPGVFIKPLTLGDNSMLCEFHLKQGALIPEHQHPHEQSGYLVSGQLRLFGAEGEQIVQPGSSWNFKGGVPHGAEALTEVTLIEVFSPVREDYLRLMS
jgi:quercetin dioxygenase-like cupin family protein